MDIEVTKTLTHRTEEGSAVSIRLKAQRITVLFNFFFLPMKTPVEWSQYGYC